MRLLSPARGCGLAALSAAVLTAGCGRPVGTVEGVVKFEGKPLKAAYITFVSADGGQSFPAAITGDGKYSIPDIRGGEYKVCVETNSFKPPPQAAGPTAQPVVPKGAKTAPPPGANIPEGYTPSDPAAMAAAGAAKKYVPLPQKYAKPETTDLTFTFKGGSATYDIDLK